MDEKTEELRDIFMSVSDDETVTETQAETRGSLAADEDDERVTEQLRGVVESLREYGSFETAFDTETYVALGRAFYDDMSDDEIADQLDRSPAEVFRARIDLHLIRESDTEAPFDICTLHRRRDATDETLAAELDVDTETIRHYRRVVSAQNEARAVNYRFQSEFDELLTDADLAGQFTESMQDDGLDEAAEDIETDVSF